ncbi:hypothetical protein CROQUDRAFT_669695 [Cronartium quercuum f. sp. fusiforme G11]|uniref:J domain-containing protein n=1 Tax=Cronartium quercuum f. sp. fusiforme G11 TaxID=708437 RepID=A0A9P6NMV3_9BASI|nr:hypothetical protein CROQUDRAFT_669695 [Cronartium quercuum f. sp. fusiforme G11]
MDDPYSILNVYPDCTYDEAKAAYRKAALMHHPDRHPPARKAEAERRFRILANAFQQVCHELGHPIEPPEIVPSAPPPAPPGAKLSAVTNHQNGSSLARINGDTRSTVRVEDGFSYEPDVIEPTPARRGACAPRDELIRNRELDHLEEQSPYDEADLDPRPNYTHACPPPNAYAQDHHSALGRAPSNAYSHDQPRRGYREGVGRSGGGNYERPSADKARYDEYPAPRRSVSSQYPAGQRRSSFSQSGQDWPGRRDLVELDPRPYGRGPERIRSHTNRPQHDLYDLKPSRRRDGFGGADEWDSAFGMPADDFFGGGRSDPFGSTGGKMAELGLGFDKLMTSAMEGLNLSGPGPGALDNIGTNPNCMMRVRQSKTVMGQNEDGSWTGQKLDKQMRVGNGRMEINENGQDIRISSEGAGGGRSMRNGNGRGHGEDWDPPPAYEGDEDELVDDDRHRPHPDDYNPQPHRRLAGPLLDRYGPDRMDREPRSRPLEQSGSGSVTRARPTPTRGYLDDGPAHSGYGGGGNVGGARGYLDDGPSGYGGGGGGGLTRTPSLSKPRSNHPEGRSMVRRPEGPVVRR